jgi:hypothetical protein
MAYDTHILYSMPGHLLPTTTPLLALPGVGAMEPAFSPARPPQSGQAAYAQAAILPQQQTVCSSCNLVPIPYNASLPTLRM